MGHLSSRMGLLTLVIVLGLYGCGGSSSDISEDRSGRSTSPEKKISVPRRPTANLATDARRSLLNNNYEHHLTEKPASLTPEFDDPDPSVRLQAMEVWAMEPKETLDPLTYALVDPDESVRARAQELLEEELARR